MDFNNFQNENDACIDTIVRPDGLPVRSLRTASPKATYRESAHVGLKVRINLTHGDNGFACLFPQKEDFKIVPHIFTFSPEMPMYKGLRHVRDIRFSLTSPSRFYFWSLPLGVKGTQNVRVM